MAVSWPNDRRPNVVLIVETSVVYGRQILRGISRYLKTRPGWSVFLDERELRVPPPDWLSHWHGDGVICRSTTPEWARIPPPSPCRGGSE